jgi:hypothetical protein
MYVSCWKKFRRLQDFCYVLWTEQPAWPQQGRNIDSSWQSPIKYPDVSDYYQIGTPQLSMEGVCINAIWMSSVSFMAEN